MKKNFAGQPSVAGGEVIVLTGNDLVTEITPYPSSFYKNNPMFIDNCCDKSNMRNFDDYGDWDYEKDMPANVAASTTTSTTSSSAPKSGGGGFFSGVNLGSLLQTGAQVYTTSQQSKTAQQQAQLALQIERQKVEQAKAKVEEEKQKAQTGGKPQPKSYTIPIIISGVVVIGVIASYFYFKKKNK